MSARIPTIHVPLDREVVRIRVWTDADGLVTASLGQGLGEVALRLRPDSAAVLALALAQALCVSTDGGRGGAGTDRHLESRHFETLGRRDRPAHGKEVLR